MAEEKDVNNSAGHITTTIIDAVEIAGAAVGTTAVAGVIILIMETGGTKEDQEAVEETVTAVRITIPPLPNGVRVEIIIRILILVLSFPRKFGIR